MKYVAFLIFACLTLDYAAEKVTVISSVLYSAFEKNVDNDGKYIIEKVEVYII